MFVMKFGGTSVGDARRVRASARIALTRPGPNVLVVSACGGVTNLLLEAGNAAARRDDDAVRAAVAQIHAKHQNVLDGLGNPQLQADARCAVDTLHASLDATLGDISTGGEMSTALSDRLVSHGEKCMSVMMSATIRDMGVPSEPVFTDTVLATDGRHGSARPNRELTRERASTLVAPLLDAGNTVVATGFIGFAPDGTTTTLGRGGSDYSATLLGAALDADEVQIWTDVPGMLSADPRKVPSARVVSEVSYDEAQELAHFGAKVLHPRTIRPAVSRGIPVRILSTFEPTNAGTVVRETTPSQRIKAITTLKGLTLLTIDVPELEDLANAASAVFRVLHEDRVELISVSQSSSRRRMTFILDAESAGCSLLQPRLKASLGDMEVLVQCSDNVAVVAAVGEGAANMPSALSQLLGVLSRANVPVLATSQQNSNAAMVVVVPGDDADHAVKLVHDSLVGTARVDKRLSSRRRADIIGESLRVG